MSKSVSSVRKAPAGIYSKSQSTRFLQKDGQWAVMEHGSSGWVRRGAISASSVEELLQQGKLKRYCDREHVVLTAYSPLGSRDRNPAFRAKDEPDMLEIEVIRKLAAAHAATPAQILLAWAVNRGTSVIPKSVNPQRLQLNFDAAAIELNSTEMNLIDGLDRHYRYVTGSFFAGKNSPYTIGGIWDE